MSKTYVKTIAHLERLNHSRNGNPAYRIYFTDGTVVRTETDASIAYAIGNPEFRDVPVEFTVTRAGRVSHAEPVATD